MKRVWPAWTWALGLLILLLLFNAITSPIFFHLHVRDGKLFGSLIDVLFRASPVLLLSLGMTLVIGTGGVDLSVGAVMAIAGAVGAVLVARPPGSPLSWLNVHGKAGLAVIWSCVAGLLCGLFNGSLVAVMDLQPIVATLLLMVAGRGIAQLLTGGQIITFDNPGLSALASGHLLWIPVPIWIVAGAAIVFGVLARWTAFGLFIESTGSNPTAAAYAGVNVSAIRFVVYALSGVCAALAGLIVAADIRGADANNAGLNLELDAILAVCVGGSALMGGRFSLGGSLIGAILMQTVTTTILSRGVPPEAAMVVKALIVVGVCLLQSPEFNARMRRLARRVSA